MSWPDQRRFELPRQKGGVHLYQAVHPATVTRFGGEERWYLLHDPIGWRANAPPDYQYPPVDVPAGFVTDLASVPWYLWNWLPADGPYMHAAIVHDWLYWDQQRSREEADNILWVDMTDLKVGYQPKLSTQMADENESWSGWPNHPMIRARHGPCPSPRHPQS